VRDRPGVGLYLPGRRDTLGQQLRFFGHAGCRCNWVCVRLGNIVWKQLRQQRLHSRKRQLRLPGGTDTLRADVHALEHGDGRRYAELCVSIGQRPVGVVVRDAGHCFAACDGFL